MKRIFTLLCLAAGFVVAEAQITAGFYHVRNKGTQRYMIMTDYTKGTTEAGKEPDLTAVQSTRNEEIAFTHPGAVCYIAKVSGEKYDVMAQNTSIGKLTNGQVYPVITKQSDGTYTIWGSYSGYELYIGDAERAKYEDSYCKEVSAGNDRSYWEILPIDNTATGQFIGIKPTVQTADGKYWGTILCGFEFTLHSEGMKAYIVDEVSDTEFQLKQITSGKVPAHTPVVIECSSNDYSKNIIRPTSKDGSTMSGNKLGGVYYDRLDSYHTNAQLYDETTMRVLGVNEKGFLAFRKATAEDMTVDKNNKWYLPHNKAYLGVSATAADVLTEKNAAGIRNINTIEETVKEGTYNLSGQRVADEPTRPGIYIRNGKKIIIK